MTDLLSCPFCASENIGVGASQDMDDAGNYIEEGRQWTVLCNGCGASSSLYSHSEGEAIAAWNTRAPAQCTLASNATTISCSGKDITIACDDHDTKQAVMDALTGDGEPAASDLCAGGVKLKWDACPKCGATMDDACKFESLIASPAPLADEAGMREALWDGVWDYDMSRLPNGFYQSAYAWRRISIPPKPGHKPDNESDAIAALRPSQAAAVLPAVATSVRPVAIVMEQLDGNEARVQWMFNPVPDGQELLWDHGDLELTGEVALARPPELENEKLREALKPFAEAASNFTCTIGPDGIDDGVTVAARLHGRPEREATLSSADFSRAARALRREG